MAGMSLNFFACLEPSVLKLDASVCGPEHVSLLNISLSVNTSLA